MILVGQTYPVRAASFTRRPTSTSWQATYLALFAIVLVASAGLGQRPALWLRAAAGAGFGVTVLYAVLSVFPIIEVENEQAFSAKIIAVVVGANLVGLAIYAAHWRRNYGKYRHSEEGK